MEAANPNGSAANANNGHVQDLLGHDLMYQGWLEFRVSFAISIRLNYAVDSKTSTVLKNNSSFGKLRVSNNEGTFVVVEL